MVRALQRLGARACAGLLSTAVRTQVAFNEYSPHRCGRLAGHGGVVPHHAAQLLKQFCCDSADVISEPEGTCRVAGC